jgi:hypothetical protein
MDWIVLTIDEVLFWGVVLTYFMGIGDGVSQFLCIFVLEIFSVRYYTQIFPPAPAIHRSSQHTPDIRIPVYVLSAYGYVYQQEKRRDVKKKEGERNQSEWRFLTPTHQPPTHLPDPLLFSKTASAAVSFSPLTTAPSPSSSSAPSLLFARSCSSSLILM